MKRNIARVVVFILCCFVSAFSQSNNRELTVTYVANEGFLLRSSNHKVLIDALFSDGYGLFSVPTKETIRQIMDGKAPFDSVEVYLLTHYHKDHCDPVLINGYLTKHKDVSLVTNKPAILFIDGSCFGFVRLKKQFRELTPEINQSDSTSVAGIPIKAFALKHLSFYRDSVDLEEYMYNACYLIGMDGIRVFHSGDIKRNALESYLAENKRWTDSIDVAFLYFELFDSGKTDLDYVVKTLNPRYIVVMHVPPRMMDEWTEKIAELRRYFPNILLFRNSLDSQVIDVTGSKHNDKSKEIEK